MEALVAKRRDVVGLMPPCKATTDDFERGRLATMTHGRAMRDDQQTDYEGTIGMWD